MSKPVTGLYRVVKGIAKPLMGTWVKMDVSGEEHLPAEGAFIITPNHISNFDPVCIATFMMQRGYPVRFLAKAELFRTPIVGQILRAMGMVPVERNSDDPAAVLEYARQALRDGECVGIYPEGTLTRDPQMWPMKPKTGAARLALDTGVPVIPIAQWGAHEVMPRYAASIDLRPQRPITIRVCPPVDLSDLMTDEGSANYEAVQEATRRIHAAIVKGVEEIRGEKAPAQPWDSAAMSGPDKKTLGRFSKWRRSLARRGRSLKG